MQICFVMRSRALNTRFSCGHKSCQLIHVGMATRSHPYLKRKTNKYWEVQDTCTPMPMVILFALLSVDKGKMMRKGAQRSWYAVGKSHSKHRAAYNTADIVFALHEHQTGRRSPLIAPQSTLRMRPLRIGCNGLLMLFSAVCLQLPI